MLLHVQLFRQTCILRTRAPVFLKTFNFRHDQLIRGTRTKIVTEPTIVNKLFGKYLLATNIISSGILMLAGDVMAQEIEYRRGILENRYNMLRLGRMFLVGCLQGPLHHYFYGWMNKIMPLITMRNTINKILLDQVIASPVCILLFFYPASLMEMKSFKEATDELSSKFLTVYVTDWCVWPAAQFVNFHYLNPKFHVLFVNTMTMMYNVFLSYMKHKDQKPLEHIS